MSQIRERHSAAFKAKVGVAALKGEETMAGMVSQFQVHSSWISVWRRELIEGAEGLFADGRSQDKTNEALIGQLAVGRDFLQRECGP